VKRFLFWAIHNPLLINVMMVLIFVFGWITLGGLNREMFPSVTLDQIQVSVPYPGASPVEVEQGIILPIEEAIEGIPDFDRVRATARENQASLTVELAGGADLQERLQDVKNAVDGIIGLPAGAEQPVVSSVKRIRSVLTLVLYGDAEFEAIRQTAEALREELLDLAPVSLVSVTGLPERQIAVEISEADLRRYGLSFDEVARRVREASLDMSGGSLKTSAEELRIRVYGRKYTAPDYESITLRAGEDGAVIRLGDVARVREDWEEQPEATWYDGQRAVSLSIDKTEREDTITIVRAVREWMDNRAGALPGDLRLEVLRDSSVPLRQRIELLVKNGLLGLLLVCITLTLFLRLRVSFWVAMGIPISYAGMFFLFGFTPATVNVISLFGMILVLGIVVDDAIVVGENIFQHVERGAPPVRAAIAGTLEVTPAVTASVSTTVAAFIPFFFIEGRMGLFIWQMALAVILALAVSLFECLVILPSHLAHSRALKNHRDGRTSRIRRHTDRWIEALIRGFYARSLRRLLRIHWVTVSLGVSLFLLCAGLLAGGVLKFHFFPRIDSDNLTVQVRMNPGTPEARTLEVLRRIEATARGLAPELRASQEDEQEVLLATRLRLGPRSEHGQVTLKLLDSEQRTLPAHAVGRKLSAALPFFHDAEELSTGAMGRHFGLPVSINLMSADVEALDSATEVLKEEMRGLPALTEIQDDREIGKRELVLRLKPAAEALGLTLREAARQVRQAFYGEEILRFQRGRDEIKVWTRLQVEDRGSLAKLQRLRLRSPAGHTLPAGEALDFELRRGLAELHHLDGRRVVEVGADIDEQAPGASDVIRELREDLLPRLRAAHPDLRVTWAGEQEQQKKSTDSMRRVFPVALLLIGFILIAVFRSFLQSLLVLSMIPLGLIGAILGHLLLGKSLTIISIYGLVGLSGIIINDSVIFIDRINRELREGHPVGEAVQRAGIKRFRPIMLTTFTTVMGMLPIILETSRQAQFLIPMAISVSFGLLFGTLFTVYFLPCFFLCVNDLRRLVTYTRCRFLPPFAPEGVRAGAVDLRWPSPESVEPAVARPVPRYSEDFER